MTKLPNIQDPERLGQIIRAKSSEIVVSSEFRSLVMRNIGNLPEEARGRLLNLLRVGTLNMNG